MHHRQNHQNDSLGKIKLLQPKNDLEERSVSIDRMANNDLDSKEMDDVFEQLVKLESASYASGHFREVYPDTI